MGFFQIKNTSSITPPPAGVPGQGTVDALATFFLSKFQETKQDNELTTLQCTTQLKFEAVEKMLEEQTLTIAGLRNDVQSDMQSEIQSLRDKAASYFLDKFSAQLEALGAGRSEKSELALTRLEHRVDDEIKNLSDQLSDLSTKLAISNAALNAAVNDVGKKTISGNEASAENLRRCESEFRSKMSRFESLLDSTKTEATIERDKITRMFQEVNKRLQSKVDSLELTVMRQSEELTGQCEKIDRLDKEMRNLSQLGIGQEKAHAMVVRILSTQNEELSKLALQIQQQEGPRGDSNTTQPDTSNPTPERSRLAPLTSLPVSNVEYIRRLQPTTTTRVSTSQTLGTPVTIQNTQHIDAGRVSIQRKRSRNIQRKTLLEVDEAQNDISDPSPKRFQASKESTAQTSAKVDASDVDGLPMQMSITVKERRPMVKASPSQRQTADKATMSILPRITSPETRRPQSTTVPSYSRTRAMPTPLRQQPEEKQELPGSPQMSPREQNLQAHSKSHLEQRHVLPRQDQQVPPGKAQNALEPTPVKAEAQKQGHSDTLSPKKKTDSGNDQQQKFASRREATMAFMMHVQSFARSFSASPPRSERQFIWSFLKGIPDSAWAEFMQRKLLEAYPASVRPSLGTRAKYSINFDSGLTWRNVLELIRDLQQQSGASH